MRLLVSGLVARLPCCCLLPPPRSDEEEDDDSVELPRGTDLVWLWVREGRVVQEEPSSLSYSWNWENKFLIIINTYTALIHLHKICNLCNDPEYDIYKFA